jgi:hypothetical protein
VSEESYKLCYFPLSLRTCSFHNGALFGFVGPHVDKKQPPGVSPIPVVSFQSWITKAPTVLWFTPNGLWAVIALAVYFLFPYDLSPSSAAAQAPLSWAFFAERFPLWFILTNAYVAFWHFGVLYYSKRPFIKGRPYNVDKVRHGVVTLQKAPGVHIISPLFLRAPR